MEKESSMGREERGLRGLLERRIRIEGTLVFRGYRLSALHVDGSGGKRVVLIGQRIGRFGDEQKKFAENVNREHN